MIVSCFSEVRSVINWYTFLLYILFRQVSRSSHWISIRSWLLLSWPTGSFCVTSLVLRHTVSLLNPSSYHRDQNTLVSDSFFFQHSFLSFSLDVSIIAAVLVFFWLSLAMTSSLRLKSVVNCPHLLPETGCHIWCACFSISKQVLTGLVFLHSSVKLRKSSSNHSQFLSLH